MASMGKAAILKKFFSEGSERPVEMKEMVAFKNVCTPEEWESYAKDAAEVLGVEIEEKK